MRVISVLALSFLAAAQAFMPTAGPTVTRSRGAMSMVKVLYILVCDGRVMMTDVERV